jgi:hypothetical protein
VIYLRHKEAEHSTTLSGASDYRVIYKNTDDLQRQLEMIIKEITATPVAQIMASSPQAS